MTKIYTKTGDNGTTSLYSGERRSKCDAIFQVLGDIDQLSSAIGIAISYCCENNMVLILETIQQWLLKCGSVVATPKESSSEFKLQKVQFNINECVKQIEKWIDDYDSKLLPLNTFILPSGGKVSSFLHLARTTCRQCERNLCKIEHCGELIPLFNRLSDLLFTCARITTKNKQKQTEYKCIIPIVIGIILYYGIYIALL
jgi:cob(I)alamin adenosyltransferase